MTCDMETSAHSQQAYCSSRSGEWVIRWQGAAFAVVTVPPTVRSSPAASSGHWHLWKDFAIQLESP